MRQRQNSDDEPVYVVHLALDENYDRNALRALLDQDELFRAERIPTELARKRFETAHGLTRIALARWLGVPANTIAFTRGRGGKPALADCETDLRFNLSHSGAWALLALAHAREVGIDIERERPIDALNVARRFLASGEADRLATMSGERQMRAFFRCWTRKESFVKARGDGFAYPLNQFEVSVDESEPRLIANAGPPDAQLHWTIADVATPRGYAAAVTAEGPGLSLDHWVCAADLELHPHAPALTT